MCNKTASCAVSSCLSRLTMATLLLLLVLPHESYVSLLACGIRQLHFFANLWHTFTFFFCLPVLQNSCLSLLTCVAREFATAYHVPHDCWLSLLNFVFLYTVTHDSCLSLLSFANDSCFYMHVSAYLWHTTADCLCLPMPHYSCLPLLTYAT
jgi:hypothetical protein